MKYLQFIFLLFLITVSRAATLNSDGSAGDTQSKINSASNGDTVTIPAGSFTWTSEINLGSKGITVQGAGVGSTNITTNVSGSQTHLLSFNASTGSPTRFTGITFLGGSYDKRIFKIGHALGNQCWRIDHCAFTTTNAPTIFIDMYGNGPGLIDHNSFTAPGNSEMLHCFGNSDSDWKNDVIPGGPNSVYIEDNAFTNNNSGAYFVGNSAVQSYNGARTVFRHNSLDFSQVDQHGTNGNIGARWWEIYDNTFNIPSRSSIGGQDKYMDIRAGSGVIFNNHKTGAASKAGIVLREEDSGYPALYQVGRGINQNLSPAYLWGNDSTMPVGAADPDAGPPANIILNRDYYVSTSQPSSLLRQQLSTDNSSTTYSYKPYIYPHPLTVTGPTPPPNPTPAPTPNPTPNPTPTPPVVSGAIYVDQDNSQAVDSTSNGTEAKPYKSIGYAVSRVQSGGIILVKKSSSPYNVGFLNITGPSGTSGSSTKLKAYSSDKPVLKGNGVGAYYTVSLTGVSYFDFEGFDISAADNALLVRNGSHHLNIKNCYLHDTGQEIVRVQNSSYNILFEGNTLTNGGILKANSNGEAFYIGTYGGSGGDLVNNVIIRGNTISNTEHEAVDLMTDVHDCIIENNVIHDVITNYEFGKWAISTFPPVQWKSNPNHIIRNNVVYNVGDAGLSQGGTGAAFNLGTGGQLYNNLVYGADKDGNGISTWGVEIGSGDGYTRYVWNNTFVLPPAQAIHAIGGTSSIGNNIGPSTSGNTAYNSGLFVGGNDYHLKAALPGTNPPFPIPTDISGVQRKSPPDMGAYEFAGVSPTPTPTPVPTPTPTPVPTPVPTPIPTPIPTPVPTPVPTPPPTPTPTPVPTPTPTPPPTPVPTPVPTPIPTPVPGHQISDIQGLQEALDSKADKGHTHPVPAVETSSQKGHTHSTPEEQTGE